MAIGGLDMKYKVEDSIDQTFENIRNIRLGSGKFFFVYKDNDPVLSVEINTPTCFYDAIIYHDYLVIGNYLEGIYCINLNNSETKNIKVNGYFGRFEIYQGVLYVLGCEDVMAFNYNLDLLWKSDILAVDGVLCNGIEKDTMSLSCEMDPPGGWVDRKISLLDGRVMG